MWPLERKYDDQPGRPSGVARKLVPVWPAPAMKMMGSGWLWCVLGDGCDEQNGGGVSFST